MYSLRWGKAGSDGKADGNIGGRHGSLPKLAGFKIRMLDLFDSDMSSCFPIKYDRLGIRTGIKTPPAVQQALLGLGTTQSGATATHFDQFDLKFISF